MDTGQMEPIPRSLRTADFSRRTSSGLQIGVLGVVAVDALRGGDALLSSDDLPASTSSESESSILRPCLLHLSSVFFTNFCHEPRVISLHFYNSRTECNIILREEPIESTKFYTVLANVTWSITDRKKIAIGKSFGSTPWPGTPRGFVCESHEHRSV